MTRTWRFRHLGVAIIGFAILAATLWPLPEADPTVGDEPLRVQLAPFAIDLARNMLLFAPLGALLARWPALVVLAAAGGLSLFVEVNQLWIPGRVPSPWDVVANLCGAFAGHALVRAARRAGLDDARLRRRAYLGWSAVVVVALVVAPVGFRTTLPETPWFAHWVPDLGHLETYRGSLTSAMLDGTPLPHGRLEVPGLADSVGGDHLLEIHGTTAASPADLSALFLVTNGSGQEVLIVGLRGESLMVRVATIGMRLGLEYPFLWWSRAVKARPGGRPFTITSRRQGRMHCIAVDGTERCDLGPKLEDGWQHWLPSEHVGARARHVLDRAWLVALFVPLGVGLRLRALQLGCLGAVGGAVWLAPALGPVAPIGPATAATIAVGLAAGFVGGRIVAALGRRAR